MPERVGLRGNISAAVELAGCKMRDLIFVPGGFSLDVMGVAYRYTSRFGETPLAVKAVRALFADQDKTLVDDGIRSGLRKFEGNKN